MARGSTNITSQLNAGIKMSTQFLLLNTVSQVANIIPNIPPLAKVLLSATTQVQTYRIARTALATQKGPLKSIGLALLGVYETMASIQQIPNVIAAIQQAGGTSGFLSAPAITQ